MAGRDGTANTDDCRAPRSGLTARSGPRPCGPISAGSPIGTSIATRRGCSGAANISKNRDRMRTRISWFGPTNTTIHPALHPSAPASHCVVMALSRVPFVRENGARPCIGDQGDGVCAPATRIMVPGVPAMTIRPRRSTLYMPGANARALEKARILPCDAVILDLEDAVAPDAKVTAREQVMNAVKAGGFGTREVIVRINALDTAWWLDDIAADHKIRVWAMIETPLAIINAAEIAATARDVETRLAGFVMGTNDLAKESRAKLLHGRAPMLPWLATAVLAAHAFGIDILDGVYNDLTDEEGFRRECGQGRDMGFDGKTLIHPNQIAPCNAAFSPSEADVAQARKIIAAFELPENRTKGVVQLDGRMVERMHADIARRTVAIADTIAARS